MRLMMSAQARTDERVYFEPIAQNPRLLPTHGRRTLTRLNVADIIRELETTRVSERSSRVIDGDRGASMEQKKKEGYF
jgi:hypothetical protein